MDVEAIIEVDGDEVARVDISHLVRRTLTVTDTEGLGREIESEIEDYSD